MSFSNKEYIAERNRMIAALKKIVPTHEEMLVAELMRKLEVMAHVRGYERGFERGKDESAINIQSK